MSAIGDGDPRPEVGPSGEDDPGAVVHPPNQPPGPAEADAVISSPAPAPAPDDALSIDRAFAEIVAAWGNEPEANSWPDSENLRPASSSAAEAPPATPAPAPAAAPVPAEPEAEDPILAMLDEQFVPETPPPLFAGEPINHLAWLALILGPLILISSIFVTELSGPWRIGATALFLVGGGVLIMRLPTTADEGDDGAVV